MGREAWRLRSGLWPSSFSSPILTGGPLPSTPLPITPSQPRLLLLCLESWFYGTVSPFRLKLRDSHILWIMDTVKISWSFTYKNLLETVNTCAQNTNWMIVSKSARAIAPFRVGLWNQGWWSGPVRVTTATNTQNVNVSLFPRCQFMFGTAQQKKYQIKKSC